MTKLLRNDPNFDTVLNERYSSLMPEHVAMDAFSYPPDYRVALGNFSHVRSIKGAAIVTHEDESIRVCFPGGHVSVDLPERIVVNPDDPTLASLAVKYTDGRVFKVKVAHPKREDFRTPKLSAEREKENTFVPYIPD